jgi:hypothetical protein
MATKTKKAKTSGKKKDIQTPEQKVAYDFQKDLRNVLLKYINTDAAFKGFTRIDVKFSSNLEGPGGMIHVHIFPKSGEHTCLMETDPTHPLFLDLQDLLDRHPIGEFEVNLLKAGATTQQANQSLIGYRELALSLLASLNVHERRGKKNKSIDAERKKIAKQRLHPGWIVIAKMVYDSYVQSRLEAEELQISKRHPLKVDLKHAIPISDHKM